MHGFHKIHPHHRCPHLSYPPFIIHSLSHFSTLSLNPWTYFSHCLVTHSLAILWPFHPHSPGLYMHDSLTSIQHLSLKFTFYQTHFPFYLLPSILPMVPINVHHHLPIFFLPPFSLHTIVVPLSLHSLISLNPTPTQFVICIPRFLVILCAFISILSPMHAWSSSHEIIRDWRESCI